MEFVIKTQTLENYGAHSESGLYAEGNACWKFKGGSTYIVSDCERLQDAAAFVMAAFSENGVGWKEYPCEYLDIYEWMDELDKDDEDYADFKKETAICVSPKTGRKFTKGWTGTISP